MNRRLLPLLLAMSVLLVMAATAQAAPRERTIRLNSQQEVPEAESRGTGTFTYSIDGNQLCYTLEVRNLTGSPISAHIHIGPRREAGPVVVTLLTPPGATSVVSTCITAEVGGNLTPDELAAIVANPRDFYVNVHTVMWPAGEIRGQLK